MEEKRGYTTTARHFCRRSPDLLGEGRGAARAWASFTSGLLSFSSGSPLYEAYIYIYIYIVSLASVDRDDFIIWIFWIIRSARRKVVDFP